MTITAPRVLEIFVQAADTLAEDYDVAEFLRRLADNTVEITGAHAASLLLGDDTDKLSLVAASSSDGEHLALFQLAHGEGPSVDCFRTGSPVLAVDLPHASGRWPAFAAEADRSGIFTEQTFPLRLREHFIGVLSVCSRASLPLNPTDARIVQALADVATIAIIQQRSLTAADILTSQLQRALDSRIVIEQAKGLVAGYTKLDADQAFTLIRDHARRHGIRIADLAHTLATHKVHPAALDHGTRRS